MRRSPVASRIAVVAVAVCAASGGVALFGGSATGAAAPDRATKKVLVRDDFTDVSSGFEQVNAADEFAFYNAPDGEGFTLTTVKPAGTSGRVSSLRSKPRVKNMVVEADVQLSGGSSGNDVLAGLTCRGTAPNDSVGPEVVGVLDTGGDAYLMQFGSTGGPQKSSSTVVQGLFDDTRTTHRFHLKLVCSGSTLSFSVDGATVTAKALPELAKRTGQTGLMAEGNSANATFYDYVVRKP